MTNAITTITEAFEPLKPAIAAEFIRYVTKTLGKVEEKYPGFVRVGYEWGYLTDSYRQFSTFLKPVDPKEISYNLPQMIDNEKIAEKSVQYAEDAVAGCIAKLTKKLGALDTASVKSMNLDLMTFVIEGTANGKKVFVEQQCILKVSSRGKMFNQFPARIYVDGDFTPEKNFAEKIGG